MSAVTEERLLTQRDLRTFDGESTALIFEAQQHGWRGHVSTRGHVLLRAPDGVTTMSISRDSLRGRSGRNMRAEFDRWRRKQRQELVEKVSAKADEFRAMTVRDAFGLTRRDRERAGEDDYQPPALLDELREDEALAAWYAEHKHSEKRRKQTLWWVDEKNPRRWFAIDTYTVPPVLISHGSRITTDEVWAIALEEKPGLFGQDEQTTAAGGADVKAYRCSACGETFEDKAQMTSHSVAAHREPIPCPHCERTYKTRGALNLHITTGHTGPVTCPECGKVCKNQSGFGRHFSVHKKAAAEAEAEALQAEADALGVAPDTSQPAAAEVLDELVDAGPPEVVDEPPAGVAGGGASGVSSPEPPSGDVLLDYLEVVPQGEDAEQIVASLRALVAAPLVAEIRRLNAEVSRLVEENEKLQTQAGDWEARWALIREASAL